MEIEKIKEEYAITLTAIILTVIVLLIIAGVSISVIGGSNGILQKAKTSVSAYKEQEIKEKVELKLASLEINNYNGSLYEKLVQLAKEDEEITQVLENGENVLLIINDEFVCEINPQYQIVGDIHIYNGEESQLTKVKVNLDYCTFDRETY